MTADRDIHIQSDVSVHYPEGYRISRSVFISGDLLGIDIINSLILGGIAAEGNTLSDLLKGCKNILSQLPVKDTRLAGGIPYEFARLRAKLNDLALINDQHTLAVRHSNDGAIGNNIVIALCIGASVFICRFISFCYQNIRGDRLTIEKLSPRIRKRAAGSSCRSLYQAHNLTS